MREKSHAVVVVHGTDTMAKTADYVRLKLINPSVPIIFTGAMKPMGFDDSDAFQNVTETMLSCRVCAPGFTSFFMVRYLQFHLYERIKKKALLSRLHKDQEETSIHQYDLF